jgi:hypothetical protein
VDSTTGLHIATDATKKELDGLLNAGRQACGSLQIVRSSNLTAIGLTKKLLLMPGLVADWKQSSPELHSLWLRPTTLSWTWI